MGRIIAIAAGDLASNQKINEYAVKLIEGTDKRVLFIGTASHDAEGYIDSITEVFSGLGCKVEALSLTTNTYAAGELQEKVFNADLIYVGGGDTIFMMNSWKECGLDELLKKVYDTDSALLMGISAGAICWFNCGCTDSELAVIKEGFKYGWAENMLNIHEFAYCPHYEDRVLDFNGLMQEKDIAGLAMESDTAFVENNGEIYYIKSNATSKAYYIKKENGTLKKEEIAIQLVSGCGK